MPALREALEAAGFEDVQTYVQSGNVVLGSRVRELKEAAASGEEFVVSGREVYAWHPQTIARSKLWNKLAGKTLGVTATSRNWATVEALLELVGK